MALPDIRISDVAARSSHSLRSAAHEEHPMDVFVLPELSSPIPSYSPEKSAPPSPSPIAPATLSPPSSVARPSSRVSFASATTSETLDGQETPKSPDPQCDTVLGGPITADPEPIIAGPDASGENVASKPVARRPLYLSPSSIYFFMDGKESDRYERKPMFEKETDSR
ncbi:hypothetical protein L227DRAFT_574319 [Lentinus tigrinus ALCF2SS1-6]|uniref:Uncharacterized protein n=1 Tax=Lentinus tigrinus ALCF2SS1-6 TaxID=1328759 RepID=A0A5C2SD66_9APHY|nr:hypothetical protein L227DRAFT_574319 [Lentinus tigrinus ALCF2SS1-6]